MKPKVLVLLLSWALFGCTTMSTAPRPHSYYGAVTAEPPVASLFAGDAAVLTDEAITKILDFKYEPPAMSRVALMTFGGESWSQWSEEMAASTDRMKVNVIEKLKASPRVYDASFLPSILVPESQTVPHLREAAARYQADLLVIYRNYCRSFEKYRLFAADRSRAFCSVEAVLLDIRTGLVPFTSLSTKTFEAVENDTDINFSETIMKAQLNAVAGALSEVSGGILDFISSPN